MKKWVLIVLTILSFGLVIVGFLHIPILSWCGVDVFALRGVLIFTALPIVATFSVPFAICMALIFKERKK